MGPWTSPCRFALQASLAEEIGRIESWGSDATRRRVDGFQGVCNPPEKRVIIHKQVTNIYKYVIYYYSINQKHQIAKSRHEKNKVEDQVYNQGGSWAHNHKETLR